MRIHSLKTWPEYFQEVKDRRKTFEVRKADRDFRVGDDLMLEEWDPSDDKYTGRFCVRTITYILDKPDFVKEGFVILAIS